VDRNCHEVSICTDGDRHGAQFETTQDVVHLQQLQRSSRRRME
jgi:hypothetical protein